MGDLGCGQDEACDAVHGSLCNHVRSVEEGKSGPEGPAAEEIPRRCVRLMSGKVAKVETDDLEEMYDLILNAEVVEGPPGFRDLVAELWPELLHKLKPPIS